MTVQGGVVDNLLLGEGIGLEFPVEFGAVPVIERSVRESYSVMGNGTYR